MMDDRFIKNPRTTNEDIKIQTGERLLDDEALWRERSLRLRADLENTKRRLAIISVNDVEAQGEAMLKDILPITDGLDMALKHTSREEDSRGILQGLEINRNLLEKLFWKHNVEVMEALGQPFDPSQHESIGMVKYPDVTPNTVVLKEPKGSLQCGKLLRPAHVLIATSRSDKLLML
jgi:molecular chaperone GrpE